MSEWREVKLGDVTSVITKGTTPTTLGRSFSRHGVNFVKVESISDDGNVLHERLAHIDPETHDLLARSQLREGDVLFSIAGAIGRATQVEANLLPANTNQALAVIRVDESAAHPRYVYYYLRSDAFQQHGLERVVQTAQANVSLGVLREAPIVLPPRATQLAIVVVLSAIDDMIENNRRRIALLEQMAQMIYRGWFVDFGLHHPLTDESRTNSRPKGWQMSELGSQLDVLESGARPRGGVDPNERGVPSVGAENVIGLGRYRFEAEKFVSEAFFESMRRGRVQSGDVLLYKDGAHIGRHAMFRDGFPHERCAINEHVFRLRARPPLTQNYLYFWLDRPETIDMIVGLNSNAAQPGISQKKLASLPIPVPAAEHVEPWERTVDPLIAVLFNLAKQSRVLHNVRDSLLPKLVTGAIDVSKLDLDALLAEPAS